MVSCLCGLWLSWCHLGWFQNFFQRWKHLIKKKFVKIADPALGLKKYSFFEFEKDWQGIFLVLYPVQPIVSMEAKDSIIAFYFSLFKKMKSSYFKLCFLSFFLGVFLFLTTFYFEWLIEGIHTVQKETFFYVVMLSFFFLSLLHRTTEYVHSQFLFRFADRFGLMLIGTFFSRIR